MKALILTMLMLMWAPVLGSPPLHAAGSEETGTIEGEVLNVESNTLVVKDEEGKEIALVITRQTQMGADFKPGDMVQAFVSPQGITTSVQPLKGARRR